MKNNKITGLYVPFNIVQKYKIAEFELM